MHGSITKPLEDRITVEARSSSTTQHMLTVHLDGVAMVTVDNSLRGEYPKPGRQFHGDYRDWMEHSVEEVTPWLQLWFVQRQMRFTNDPAPEQYFRHVYDGMLAEQIRRDRVDEAASGAGNSHALRERG